MNRPSMVDELETTLASLDIPHEGAAIVALCRLSAYRLDNVPLHIDAYASICREYRAQVAELRQWVPIPEVTEEDPFDALARRLGREVT